MKLTNTEISMQADGKHSRYATVNFTDLSTSEAYSLQQLIGDDVTLSKAYQMPPTITGTSTGCSYNMDNNIYYYRPQPLKPKANTLEINNIDYNEEKGIVVVVFKDGKVIKKKMCEGDVFDLNIGVALCIAEKLYGSNTKYHKEVNKFKAIVDKKHKRKECKKLNKSDIKE